MNRTPLTLWTRKTLGWTLVNSAVSCHTREGKFMEFSREIYSDASKATSIVCSSSQSSGLSTASSSQSEIGFFGRATRLVTNMLGGEKTAKLEVKSLQLAAAAAKKVCFFHCRSLNFMTTTPSPPPSLQPQRNDDNLAAPLAPV